MARTHVPEILYLVAHREEVPLCEIQNALSLIPNNLAHIIDLMEANEMVERKTRGREIFFKLGPAGKRIVLPEVERG
jgi:predicted transcriptional regulator